MAIEIHDQPPRKNVAGRVSQDPTELPRPALIQGKTNYCGLIKL